MVECSDFENPLQSTSLESKWGVVTEGLVQVQDERGSVYLAEMFYPRKITKYVMLSFV